jgi:hypothetical protein
LVNEQLLRLSAERLLAHLVNWRQLAWTDPATTLDLLLDVGQVAILSLPVVLHETLFLFVRNALNYAYRFSLGLILSIVVLVPSNRTNAQVASQGNLIMNLKQELVLRVYLGALGKAFVAVLVNISVLRRSATPVGRVLRKQDYFV